MRRHHSYSKHELPCHYWTIDELVAEFGTWVSNLQPWTMWFTGTFDPKRHLGERRRDEGFKHFVHYLETSNQIQARLCSNFSYQASPVTWVRGTERFKLDGSIHYHALLTGTELVFRKQAWRWWYDNFGYSRIEAYNKNLGAGYYLCKYVIKELGDIQFSQNIGKERLDNW